MSTDRWMDKEDVCVSISIYEYIYILYTQWNISHKERLKWSHFSKRDGPRDHHSKWSKSERKRLYHTPDMFNLKMLWFEVQSSDFSGGTVVKNPPANAGDTGLIPRPGRFHTSWSNWACEPQLRAHGMQLLTSICPEPVPWSKRSWRDEKPAHRNWTADPARRTRRSLCTPVKTQCNKNQRSQVSGCQCVHNVPPSPQSNFILLYFGRITWHAEP